MVVSWTLLLILSAPGRPTPSSSPAQADVPAQPRPARSDGDEVLLGRYRLKPKKAGGYRSDTDQFIAHVAPDGAVSFEERPRLPGPAVLPALIIGELMEGHSGTTPRDPIDAAKRQVLRPNLILSEDDLRNDPRHGPKMDFLHVTAHFREGLQRGNDRSGLRFLRKRVDQVASDRRLPAAQRRQQLFALWDECEDPPRGTPARAVIEDAARRHFPAGTPDGYSAAELAALNKQAGPGRRFDPYAAAAAAPITR
jgi:hypothetical protein